VGKTSLVERFVNDRFSEKYLTTVGLTVSQKMMPPVQQEPSDKTVQHMFLIWDIAGLEKFDSMVLNYFRGASGALAVGDVKGFGRIAFNQRLRVTEASPAAQKLLSRTIKNAPTVSVTDIFPELIGVENQLTQIVTKQISHYRLDLLNRTDENGHTRYLNLIIIACSEEDRAIIVIEDATLNAMALQRTNQQRYDTYLYRSSIEHRRNQIGRTILGQSEAIKHIVDTIQQLGHVPTAKVLLTGETGTGKNLTARMIHESAMTYDAPFIEINCAALPEQLLEAELFGYEKGAFTGALSTKPGLLEKADGGSLFLDEIGELPVSTQAKLLSAIESKTFRRLGSTTLCKVNIRIIAATNRDLTVEISAKRFREDLYYRLNVVSLHLPPLRELGEDIIMIAQHLVEMLNIQFKKSVKGFSSAARQALLSHHWPGNVRELGNCLERAMIFIRNDIIDLQDLVIMSPVGPVTNVDSRHWAVPDTGINLDHVERSLILSALQQAKNNKSQAARLLGLTRHTLRYRMEKYDLN